MVDIRDRLPLNPSDRFGTKTIFFSTAICIMNFDKRKGARMG